jgi:hypothetical protein
MSWRLSATPGLTRAVREMREEGRGHWERWGEGELAPSTSKIAGMHFNAFGSCSNPTTIGFRFRYVRGSVADGMAGPVNFSWVAN